MWLVQRNSVSKNKRKMPMCTCSFYDDCSLMFVRVHTAVTVPIGSTFLFRVLQATHNRATQFTLHMYYGFKVESQRKNLRK